jgi:hypothetical protein
MFFTICRNANAQVIDTLNFPPPKSPIQIKAYKTNVDITIDGKLNEAVWNMATPVTGFYRMEPRQGEEYKHKTSVKVLYDKDNLYFGVFCADSAGKKGIRVQDYRRDFDYGENDIFFINLDPQRLKRYCVSFQCTPLGTQKDMQIFDDDNKDPDWDALWEVKTTVTDSGWFAEFAIPFKTLRYNANDTLGWGITFSRFTKRDYEQTVFPPIPQAYSPYRMVYEALLTDIELPSSSTNIRIQPYTVGKYTTDNYSGTKPDFKLKIGGDIKWLITPHTSIDATLNTDFAETEVDRAVNNLSRFNVFFPERRQFFLENSGLWAGTDQYEIQPFFSRKIGLSSEFNSTPVPIDGGIRITEKNEKYNMAGLYVHQRGTNEAAPANFGVLRFMKNYGKQNYIGAMTTIRYDEKNTEKGFNKKNNETFTIDGLNRPNDKWTIQYMLTGSRNNGNDTLGFGAKFYAGYNANDMYWGTVSYLVSEKYVPGMGFVFANNTVYHNPGGFFIIRPKSEKLKFIRRMDPGFFVNYYHNLSDGKFQQLNIYIFPLYVEFSNNMFFSYSVTPEWQNINFDFQPLGIKIAQGDYFFVNQGVNFYTDASRKLSGSASYNYGGYFDGKLQTLNTGIRIAPIPNIAFTANYEWNSFDKLGDLTGIFNTHLFTGGLRLAYNANIQLSGFAQYNSYDHLIRYNIRFSWQYSPLSFVHLVFTENNYSGSNQRSQTGIAKISYIKQF